MQQPALLMTGAWGGVGAHLLPRLLEARPGVRFFLLLRAGGDPAGDAIRLNKLLDYGNVSAEDRARITVISGDVTLGDLGIGKQLPALAEQISEVFHLAALTRLEGSLESTCRVNVTGTRNVVDFCRGAARSGGFERLHHVSTAYVCGNRTGRILESELDVGQDFANAYERSKFEAELEVWRCQDALPVSLYRPSIVVGDSNSGRAHGLQGFGQAIVAVATGAVKALYFAAETLIDVVPVNFVTAAICRLSGDRRAVGCALHLVSGAGACTVSELVDECMEAINGCRRAQGLRALQIPALLGKVGALREPHSRVRELIRSLAPYGSTERMFDTSQSERLLDGTGIRAPGPRSYLGNVVRFAVGEKLLASGVRTRRAMIPTVNRMEAAAELGSGP